MERARGIEPPAGWMGSPPPDQPALSAMPEQGKPYGALGHAVKSLINVSIRDKSAAKGHPQKRRHLRGFGDSITLLTEEVRCMGAVPIPGSAPSVCDHLGGFVYRALSIHIAFLSCLDMRSA